MTRLLIALSFLVSGWAAGQSISDLEEKLFSERNSAAFAALLKQAEAEEIPLLTRTEARFLYYVDTRDDAAIAALAPQLEALGKTFTPDASRICAQREEFLAFVEYAKSLKALQSGDKAAFKKHITEAFWLSPQQAAGFAPHIEQLRLEEAMKTFTLDLKRPLEPLTGGDPIQLTGLLAQSQSPALLLHFWSPWSPGMELMMPDFVTTSQALEKAGIPVISILLGREEETVPEALEMQKTLGADAASAWGLDHVETPLAAQLRIGQPPVMVLVNPAGKILFNGSPVGPRLWEELTKLVPELERPAQ